MAISKQAQDTINNLRRTGTRFNIVTPVDRRIELHFAYKDLAGKEHVNFVAEVGDLGQITDTGPYFGKAKENAFCYNADGERV